MIKSFIEVSLSDWDGKISSVIFLGGCNFRCLYCQNWPLVDHPEKIPDVDISYVKEYLKTHKEWIDGVVISGGEPTLHPEFLVSLIHELKRYNLKVKLDTNGTNPSFIQQLIKERLIDYVAMDIKTSLNEEAYRKITNTNCNIETIKETISLLMNSSDIDYEFRTTLVPSWISIKTIEEIARFISSAKRYTLQQFSIYNVKDPKLRELNLYLPEEIKEMVEVASQFLPCHYRGKIIPYPHAD